MMKKVVILGANGYIARNLAFVLDRDYPDSELNLYGCEEQSIDQRKKYVQADLTKKIELKKVDLSCDVIFMMVGRTGSANGFDEYVSFIDTNEITLLNLLNEYRIQNSHAKIIFPSTRLIYKGKNEKQKEEDEKEFKTVYAMNKYACEQYLEQFNRVYDIKYCIFRICLPYGTLISGAKSYGTAEFMLSKATKGENITIFGNGSVRRTLTHIEDLCKTMIIGAFSDSCYNDVFNIGGEDYSLNEMAELIAKKYDVSIDYVPWPDILKKIESGDTVFDSEKLEAKIGKTIKVKFVDWVNR